MNAYHSLLLFFLLGALPAHSAPPYDPYSPQKPTEVRLKGNTVVTVRSIRVAVDMTTQERSIYIDYEPSSRSKNMWNQIVEMYDVAQQFNPLATLENVSKIRVTPMLNSDKVADSKNVSYPYRVVDGVASSDWKIEFQPWFRSE